MTLACCRSDTEQAGVQEPATDTNRPDAAQRGTPVLKYHNTTVRQYPSTTILKYSSTTVPRYHSTAVPQYLSTPIPQYLRTPVPRGLCRMKMLPVMILAKYHSSARSAVSERFGSLPNFPTRTTTYSTTI